MKKLTLFFCVLAAAGFAQQDQSWRFGLRCGLHGNSYDLSGGSENANARFEQHSFGGGAFELNVRYDCTKHWMFATGIGMSSYGFDFSLSQDYSLRAPYARLSHVLDEHGSLEVPAMVYYKFNPDCRNNRWLIGAGFVHNFTGEKTISGYYSGDAEANPTADYLKVESSSQNQFSRMIRLEVAKERMMKRGSILQAALVLNAGLETLAKAHVLYQVNGQTYEHSFENKGNYAGIRMTWFFRPLNVKN